LDVWTDILRLVAWTVVVALLLLLPVSRKLARQREHAGDAATATPAGAAA
jgi:hypothetical protein